MKYIMKVTFCIKHKFFNNIYSIKSIEYTTNENAMILGKIYCNNINYLHEKIKFLPMGCDFRSIKSFHFSNINNNHRDILCYCNFSLNTRPVRRYIYNCIKNKTPQK